jgi:hypothetical protein
VNREMQAEMNESENSNAHDANIFIGLAVGIHLDSLDGLDNICAFRDSPEHRVLPVQPWRGNSRDKKLRPICIWASVSHRESERLIVLECGSNFVLELRTPDGSAARSIT